MPTEIYIFAICVKRSIKSLSSTSSSLECLSKHNRAHSIQNYNCVSHPHNFYLQWLVETGIFGLFLFLIYIYLIFNFIYNNIASPYAIIAFATLIILFWPIMSTGSLLKNSASLVENWSNFILLVLCAQGELCAQILLSFFIRLYFFYSLVFSVLQLSAIPDNRLPTKLQNHQIIKKLIMLLLWSKKVINSSYLSHTRNGTVVEKCLGCLHVIVCLKQIIQTVSWQVLHTAIWAYGKTWDLLL